MRSSADTWAVIVAAGRGARFGATAPKALVELAGKPMAQWSIDAFRSHRATAGITLVVPSEHAREPAGWLAEARERGIRIAAGGPHRTDSVRLGLRTVEGTARRVPIHDAARPLITAEIIDRVLAAVPIRGGAIAARRVTDTLKEVDREGRIRRTPDRERLWRAETPQIFDREVFLEVHRRAQSEGVRTSDCASLCERYGVPVRVVEIEGPNLKVTTRADLRRAALWLMHGRLDAKRATPEP